MLNYFSKLKKQTGIKLDFRLAVTLQAAANEYVINREKLLLFLLLFLILLLLMLQLQCGIHDTVL